MSNVCNVYHIVFGTYRSQMRISEEHKKDLYNYMCGVIFRQCPKASVLAINGIPNHIHILIKSQTFEDIPSLVRDLKRASSYFMKELHADWFPLFVKWKSEYASFSCSTYGLERLIDYINNQNVHHRVRTYKNEMIALCNRADIQFYDTGDYDE